MASVHGTQSPGSPLRLWPLLIFFADSSSPVHPINGRVVRGLFPYPSVLSVPQFTPQAVSYLPVDSVSLHDDGSGSISSPDGHMTCPLESPPG